MRVRHGGFPILGEALCRRQIPIRSGGCCERCGRSGTTLHHRKKRSQGGEWSLTNIVALCGHGTLGCHGWVEHNPNDAAAEGYHVRSWVGDPADIPIWQHHLHRWTRLTVDLPTYSEVSEVIDIQDDW